MINGKAIGISAGVAFALSFLTGIISKNSFPAVFRRSFVFALIFAALAALVFFLYEKFLQSDSPDDAHLNESSRQKTGGNVDIVISDDNLDDDGSGPKFFVENNRHSFSQGKTEDVPKTDAAVSLDKDAAVKENNALKNDSSPSASNVLSGHDEKETDDKNLHSQSFTPSTLEKVTSGNQSQDSASAAAAGVISSAADGQSPKTFEGDNGIEADDIDELPDIGDFKEDSEKNDSSDIIDDSDFASNGASESASAILPNGVEASAQNADVMAQAIRTLLKKDDN